MIKRLKPAIISTKLLISFSVAIIIFAGAVVYVNYALAQADARYRHMEFALAGTDYVIEMQRSFTEFIMLSRNSFLNDVWREAADEALIREFEAYITSSYQRIMDKAERYMHSIENDGAASELEQTLIIYDIYRVFSYAEEIYNYLYTYFFSVLNTSHTPSDILHQILDIEEILLSALDSSLAIRENSINNIHNYISRTRTSAVILSLAVVIAVVILLSSTIRGFYSRIKKIEKLVVNIKKGDFAACITSRIDDEISRGISEIVYIFMLLIEEIHNASVVTKTGIVGARIDTNGFEGGYRETARAINFLLNSIDESNAVNQLLFNSMPLVVNFWDKNMNLIDCNNEAARRFGLADKQEYKDKFYELSPEYQPDGEKSDDKMKKCLQIA